MGGNGCTHVNTENKTIVENGEEYLVTVCTASGCGQETARTKLS